MNKFLVSLIWFIIVFILIYLYEYFFAIRSFIKNRKKVSVETNLAIQYLQLDINKIDVSFIRMVSLIASFDVAFIYSFVAYFIKNIYLSLFFCLLLSIPVIIISYRIYAFWYRKNHTSK